MKRKRTARREGKKRGRDLFLVGSGQNEILARDGPDLKLASDPALMLGRIHDQVQAG